MGKVIEFENVYIELPETYILEEEEKAERVIDVAEPTIETEEVVEENKIETTELELEEEVEEEPRIIIDLPPSSKIVEDALKDIEKAEKEEKKQEATEDPAVTKQATTKLSFEELQKRLEETQALHL